MKSENKPGAPIGTEKEAEESKIFQSLRARFPGQVHGKNFTSQEECNLMTWVNVFEFSKRGLFDRIRPDILVNNFQNILEIHRFYDIDPALNDSTVKEENLAMENEEEEVINK